MTRTWLRLLILLTAALTCTEAPCAPGNTDAIEVGFVYNFTHFIRWPQTDRVAPQAVFVIAVIGDPAMLAQMAVLEHGSYRVDDRPIRVKSVADPSTIPDCSILFIGSNATAQIDAILRRLSKRAVLTIGDSPGLAKRGVAINFYHQRERVRFAINPGALERAGLTAEAQLFDVAKIVNTGIVETGTVK
jgi:hypothetical protein